MTPTPDSIAQNDKEIREVFDLYHKGGFDAFLKLHEDHARLVAALGYYIENCPCKNGGACDCLQARHALSSPHFRS